MWTANRMYSEKNVFCASHSSEWSERLISNFPNFIIVLDLSTKFRQTKTQTNNQTDRQRDKQTDQETNRQTNKKQTDQQRDRQTSNQTKNKTNKVQVHVLLGFIWCWSYNLALSLIGQILEPVQDSNTYTYIYVCIRVPTT